MIGLGLGVWLAMSIIGGLQWYDRTMTEGSGKVIYTERLDER